MAGDVLIKTRSNISKGKGHPGFTTLQSTMGAFVDSQVPFVCQTCCNQRSQIPGCRRRLTEASSGALRNSMWGLDQGEKGPQALYVPFLPVAFKGRVSQGGRSHN